MVGLLFLGVHRANKPDVGDILEVIARNFRFVNEHDSVGAVDASPHTLCEHPNSLAAEMFQASLILGCHRS